MFGKYKKKLRLIERLCLGYQDDYDSLRHNESLGKKLVTGKARHECTRMAEVAEEIMEVIHE